MLWVRFARRLLQLNYAYGEDFQRGPCSWLTLLVATNASRTRTNCPNARNLGGRVIVSSSKQYREFADECLDWARTARSDRERRIFLQMAETWLQAADLADQRERRQAGTGDARTPHRSPSDSAA